MNGFFMRKLRKLAVLVFSLLAIPLLLIVRLLSSLVIIRFGILPSDRIGHFAGNIELYFCKQDLYPRRKKFLDIFYYSGRVCNQQLKKMLERKVHVFSIARIFAKANQMIPGGRRHTILLKGDSDTEGLLLNTQAHLSFTSEEKRLGYKALESMGISKEAPFVCLYVRDSSYMTVMFPERDWSYHDYRDATIDNYLMAAEELVKRGYFVLRMGSIVKGPLKTSNPKILDYAVKHRTDFLDIFLSAKCHIFLGTNSGIYTIPRVFRRPVLCTNLVPLAIGSLNYLFPGSMFIPKKIWLKKERRFMTFKEICGSKIYQSGLTQEFDQFGVEVIENTPNEICDLAKEGEDRYKGIWQETDEDRELQERFWSISNPNKFDRKILVRIGTKFLRQNKCLLCGSNSQ